MIYLAKIGEWNLQLLSLVSVTVPFCPLPFSALPPSSLLVDLYDVCVMVAERQDIHTHTHILTHHDTHTHPRRARQHMMYA
jgi:hypothetical protein